MKIKMTKLRSKILISGLILLGALFVGPRLIDQPTEIDEVVVLKKTPILKRPASLPKYLGYSHVRNSNALIRKKDFKTYCSSVNVQHKGAFYTLTNAHCCASTGEGRFLKEVYVKGSAKARNVLRVDRALDTCVLDNPEMQGVTISSESVQAGEQVTTIGYPLGGPLRVFTGHFRYYKKVDLLGCHLILVLQGKCPKMVRGVVRIKAAPGSSGSPVYNINGELVGLIHAIDLKNPNDIMARMVTLNHIKYQLDKVHDSNK